MPSDRTAKAKGRFIDNILGRRRLRLALLALVASCPAAAIAQPAAQPHTLPPAAQQFFAAVRANSRIGTLVTTAS
jgi:hypothetical protein